MIKLIVHHSGLDENQTEIFTQRESTFREEFLDIFNDLVIEDDETVFEFDYIAALNQFQPKVIPEEMQKEFSNRLDLNQDFYLEFFTY